MHPVHPSSGVRGYEGTGVREIWVHGVHGCTVFSFSYIARVRAHRYNGAEPAVDSNQWSVFLQGGKAEWRSARSRVAVRSEQSDGPHGVRSNCVKLNKMGNDMERYDYLCGVKNEVQ